MYHINHLKSKAMKNLKNSSLRNELTMMLAAKAEPVKNDFMLSNRFAIDFATKEPIAVESYMYKKESDRDADFEIIKSLNNGK